MEYLDKIVVGGLAALVAWLFRTVLTNKTQVEVVKANVKAIKESQEKQERYLERLDGKLDRISEKQNL